MDIEIARSSCLAMPYATEDMPFGPDTLAFRVGGKIFALMSLDEEVQRLNLKYPAEGIEELRDKYDYVIPGYHMNKSHWNSVMLHDGIDIRLVQELIKISYDLILASLNKKQRESLI